MAATEDAREQIARTIRDSLLQQQMCHPGEDGATFAADAILARFTVTKKEPRYYVKSRLSEPNEYGVFDREDQDCYVAQNLPKPMLERICALLNQEEEGHE